MQRTVDFRNTPRAAPASRARTLAAALAFVLLGTSFYATNVQSEPCGAQSDFIAGSGPLPAPVYPADCSRLFRAAPDFKWPAASGASRYTVVVTFPDGTRKARTTDHNWLAWDEALPSGEYSWQVVAAGSKRAASQPRTFTVDSVADAYAPARRSDLQHAAASPSTYPRDSHGVSTLDVTAPASAGRESAGRATRGPASTPTAWTSPGVQRRRSPA